MGTDKPNVHLHDCTPHKTTCYVAQHTRSSTMWHITQRLSARWRKIQRPFATWHNTLRLFCKMAQHKSLSSMWHRTQRLSAVWHNTQRLSAVLHNTQRLSPVWHNTLRLSPVWHNTHRLSLFQCFPLFSSQAPNTMIKTKKLHFGYLSFDVSPVTSSIQHCNDLRHTDCLKMSRKQIKYVTSFFVS